MHSSTVASVNSALQRARATLAARRGDPGGDPGDAVAAGESVRLAFVAAPGRAVRHGVLPPRRPRAASGRPRTTSAPPCACRRTRSGCAGSPSQDSRRVAAFEVRTAVGEGEDADPPGLVEQLPRQRRCPGRPRTPDLVAVRELAQQEDEVEQSVPDAQDRRRVQGDRPFSRSPSAYGPDCFGLAGAGRNGGSPGPYCSCSVGGPERCPCCSR
jgi:hypothetical protein